MRDAPSLPLGWPAGAEIASRRALYFGTRPSLISRRQRAISRTTSNSVWSDGPLGSATAIRAFSVVSRPLVNEKELGRYIRPATIVASWMRMVLAWASPMSVSTTVRWKPRVPFRTYISRPLPTLPAW